MALFVQLSPHFWLNLDTVTRIEAPDLGLPWRYWLVGSEDANHLSPEQGAALERYLILHGPSPDATGCDSPALARALAAAGYDPTAVTRRPPRIKSPTHG
jgi:hypothetical protein